MARGLETQHKRGRLDSIQSNTIDPSTLEQLFVRWISRAAIPFQIVEMPEFRDLLYTSIQRSITDFQQVIIQLKNGLYDFMKMNETGLSHLYNLHYQRFISQLIFGHLLTAFLKCVIGHYIAENGDLRQSVIGLREIYGRHTGEHQESVVMNVIREFGIASKLGYFMMDNAANNDTMIV